MDVAVVYGSATHSPAFTIPAQLTAAYFPLTLIPQPLLHAFFKPSADYFASGAPVLHFTVPVLPSLLGLANSQTMLVEDLTSEWKLDDAPRLETVVLPVGPLEAKALAALTLVAVFGARVLMTHWRAPAVRISRLVTEVKRQ